MSTYKNTKDKESNINKGIGLVMLGVSTLTVCSIFQILNLGEFALIPVGLQQFVILAFTITNLVIMAKVIDILLKENERLSKENSLYKKLADEVQKERDFEELERND